MEEKGYAVVVVAEGAGEELLGESTVKDASGWVDLSRLQACVSILYSCVTSHRTWISQRLDFLKRSRAFYARTTLARATLVSHSQKRDLTFVVEASKVVTTAEGMLEVHSAASE